MASGRFHRNILRLRDCHFAAEIYLRGMLQRLTPAHFFLMGGVVLAVIGLILWWVLPIQSSVPPFLFTGVLAILYGGYDFWRNRSTKKKGDPGP